MNENDSAGQPGQNSPDGGSASQQRRRRRRRSRRRSSGGGQQNSGQTTQSTQTSQTAPGTQNSPAQGGEKKTGGRDESSNRSRSRRRRKSGSQSPASGQQSGGSAAQGQSRRSRSKPGAKTGAKSGARSARSRKQPSQRHRRPDHGGPRMETRDETSAGGLVISGLAEAVRGNGEVDLSRIYVALIGRLDRRGRLLWSMPKGHVEPGEKRSSTAEREVWEETGVHGQVIEELGVIDYWFVSEGVRIHKTVHHYLLRFVDGELNDEDPEVTEVAWIPASELIEHLAYADERKLARIAHDRLPELARAEHEAGRATPR